MSPSKAFLFTAMVAAVVASCNRPLLDRGKPAVERTSATIPPSRFKVLATIAGGGGGRSDLQISATVRQILTDSGFTAVRRAGRWDNEADAVRSICAPGQSPAVDGVLFVWYNRMELRDCTTEGAAFEIGGEGASIGITQMAERLVKWLKRDDARASSPTPGL